jgi:hypothetical protein
LTNQLRNTLPKLFDIGYLTVTPDYRVEVSVRIKEEYHNGHEYYAHHGQRLAVLPESAEDQPSSEFLEWHNQSVFVSCQWPMRMNHWCERLLSNGAGPPVMPAGRRGEK